MSSTKPEGAEPPDPAAEAPTCTITRPVDGSLLSIMRFAETMANAMQDFYEAMESARVDDFEALSQDITSIRGEIARLQADDISGNMLPAVGETLEGLRGVMAGSAETILHHAEAALQTDWRDGETYAAEINMHLMRIMEACAFQDLAGQRLDRIGDMFGDLQGRLERFAAAVGTDKKLARFPAGAPAHERRRSELMLHGPQNGKDAVGQDEIDRIFRETD